MAFKDKGFGDRLSNAANARKAALAKFQARPRLDDPEVLARQAARQEQKRIAEATRVARAAEKEAARLAEEARLAAEQDARKKAEQERQEREAAERAALEAAQKAKRDARYAARKARK